jgi:translation elongation factor Ts
LISRLRKETSFSISECKKALEETHNDYNKALLWLQDHAKQMGFVKAEKLKDRVVQEGWISIFPSYDRILLTEVNCETDFVARHDLFHQLIERTNQIAIQYSLFSLSGLINHILIKELLHECIFKLGENIQIRRVHLFEKHSKEHIFEYFVHDFQPSHPHHGRIISAIRIPSSISSSMARQFAQHIAGMKPLSKEDLYNQPFLFDPSKKFAEIANIFQENMEFIRWERAEPITKES